MNKIISLYRDAVRDDWDKQTDATLANMQEAEQNLLSRLAAGEEAVKKVAELEKDSERKADLFVKKCFECDEFERQAVAGQRAVDAMEKFSNKYKQWVSDYPKVVQKSKFFDDLIEMLQHKEAL